MNKANQGRFFEDFELEQVLVHAIPRSINAGDVAIYQGLTGSRNTLHCSTPCAANFGFSAAPVENLLVFHIAFGKTVADVSLNAVANLGYAEVKFLLPVFVGDSLHVESKVIGLKENSDGKTGIVYVHSRAFNQDNEKVLTWKRWVMVRKREQGMTQELAMIPEFIGALSAEQLKLPRLLDFRKFSFEATGENYIMPDYQPGEIIDHIDGLTVDDSDHTLATKLYQNNAKVHFNAHQMQDSRFGKRLMYGGHVMSVCRALSGNGLANAVWIAAINGGSHLNPVFGGDTLYARSQVIDTFAVDEKRNIGAVRTRLLGYKNCHWSEIESQWQDGSRNAPENLVLDLDYTQLLPLAYQI